MKSVPSAIARTPLAKSREEVRKLDEAIQGITEKLELAKIEQELASKRATYLDQLEGFVATTAK